jgi:cellulose synthase/poly-beta-1,6-N-acetylglucosamine synthase-like glycosyltransferase
MLGVRILQAALGALAVLWAAYVIVMPLLAKLRRARPVTAPDAAPTISVIIPSHDMEPVIGPCIDALKASDYPMDRVAIYVVADHCSDRTAERGREAGASILERGVDPPGKTYALAWAFETLAAQGVDSDFYVVTDATARVDRAFLRALVAGSQAGENIVVAHSIVDLGNRKWFAKCLGLTLVHRNLQNWARQRLGLSSLIEGRGMCYSRRYIRTHGWSLALPTQSRAGQHPTEDWRHGVRVVEHGYRVAYADDARVYTPLRANLGDATRQGIRWERGRQVNAITHGLRLLTSAIRTRNRVTFFAALDSIQLPVAILGVLCAGLAVLTWALPAGPLINALGIAPVVLVSGYGLLVTFRGRRDGIPATTVIWAPFYLLWRLGAFVLAWTPAGRR